MKLYTEEQVRVIIGKAQLLGLDNNFLFEEDFIIEQNESIQLPSDEEIDKHVEDDFINATMAHKYSEEIQLLMKAMCKAGMQCMRDKIQGVNNEQ